MVFCLTRIARMGEGIADRRSEDSESLREQVEDGERREW